MKRLAFALSVWTALASPLTAAPEPWADAALPVADGMELWFDSQVQEAARKDRGWPTLDPQQFDAWLDGSGHRRDARQPVDSARPRFAPAPGGASIRFDGVDDFLAATPSIASPAATLFIVAAPVDNAGSFRAFASANANGRNDYTSGFNVDLGSKGTPTFDALNVEGSGARGETNLLTTRFDFGTFHVFTVVCGECEWRLLIDGAAQGRRERKPGTIGADEFTLGARHCSNERTPPRAQDFFHGDIAEVIYYSRALPDAERARVQEYLHAKHFGRRPASAQNRLLAPVKNPPPVQMLVPGFTVREVPVTLPNINNVRYRADGKLFAVGYNGHVWLLSDTDGDGLEDKAEPFWDRDTIQVPIGAALTPPGHARGQGLFLAAKNRVVLLVDKDGDGHADEDVTVATWDEFGEQRGVDALGCAVGPDGSVYFSLGAKSYSNAYVIDKTTGASKFRLESDRGTIQRAAPDFSQRETVCRGIRFAVGLAFNRLGDLFATDQEGATWLPNGNPFDELLHIETGRYYGFPPRHPQHLPQVIDEPSVFDFAPQHQSACGLQFNDQAQPGAATFGPLWWAGDAFVTGESRGKLWRTKLVKTPAGYVAQNQLIACLSMLAVDCAVSPRGELVVACHSGNPDWGSGPNGEGKLFKITPTAKETPQPLAAWAAAPGELRVAFDRELDAVQLRNLAQRAHVEQGRFVTAGDRFESFRPGYQAVKNQLATPREAAPVLGAALSADKREIVLSIPPSDSETRYAITLPGLAPQTEIDVACDLSGVACEWTSATGEESWRGWLPHFNIDVAAQFLAASRDHARLWELLKKPGTLTLRGQLDLWQMLQPEIQPGAKLDYERPAELVSVVFSAHEPFKLTCPDRARALVERTGQHTVEVQTIARENHWLPFTVVCPTGNAETDLTLHWSTSDDPRPRAFPLRRLLLPWAKPASDSAPTARQIPEIAGGDWERGKALFFGKALCSTCHQAGGAGGHVGPDLSNLVQRDYASVLRDIREPSAALNPDHLGYLVELRDGGVFTGVFHGEENAQLSFAEPTGKERRVPRADMKSMQPMSISLMPPGLLEALTAEQQRDLLTFLLTEPRR